MADRKRSSAAAGGVVFGLLRRGRRAAAATEGIIGDKIDEETATPMKCIGGKTDHAKRWYSRALVSM